MQADLIKVQPGFKANLTTAIKTFNVDLESFLGKYTQVNIRAESDYATSTSQILSLLSVIAPQLSITNTTTIHHTTLNLPSAFYLLSTLQFSPFPSSFSFSLANTFSTTLQRSPPPSLLPSTDRTHGSWSAPT